MKSRNNDEIELEEALAREKENLEKLLLECYEQDKSHLQAKALEQMHQGNLHLWKETEYVHAIERERLERVKCEHELVKGHVEVYKRDVYAMREERDNALKLVHEITTKHENMCSKAKEFESRYKVELILTKALIEEKQEITTKHEKMCLKAERFESKYEGELVLTKALMKENKRSQQSKRSPLGY
ncbi:unnamed protein product [Arabis nemorensis]|uniref:Uncharacterized protein n=1 Tax=Arabis nemorensis TaxID=586526 RepID=A0A565CVN0_9BRAS|nr:unnamed protein product [Arabis nemorensis]